MGILPSPGARLKGTKEPSTVLTMMTLACAAIAASKAVIRVHRKRKPEYMAEAESRAAEGKTQWVAVGDSFMLSAKNTVLHPGCLNCEYEDTDLRSDPI